MTRQRVRSDLARAALRGAAAGVLGGLAMRAMMEVEERALLPEAQRTTPPPEKVVEKAERKAGTELSPGQERVAAMGVHLGYGALWGAVHGVGSELLDVPPLLHGLLLGGLVYWTGMGPSGFLTKMGVAPSPMLQPIEQAAIPVGAHVAYGLATAAAYEALS